MKYGRSAFAALLCLAAAFYLYPAAGVAPHIPADLRDAPNSGGAGDQLGIEKSSYDTSIPVPAAAEPVNKSVNKGAPGEEEPFLALHLYSAPFMGATPAETKRTAAKFLAGLGMKVTNYQDNNTCRAVDAEFRAPTGMMDKIKSALERSAAVRQIEALPEVANMHTYGRNPLAYTIVFKEPLYNSRVDELLGRFGGELTITGRNQNRNMLGSLWVDVEIKDVDAARYAAPRLPKDFPDKISFAQVSKRVTTFSATVR